MANKYQGKGFVQLTGRQMAQINMNTLKPVNVTAGSSTWNPFSNLSLNGSDFDSIRQSPSITKFEAYDSPEDILTLSCTLQRMREANDYGHRVLDESVMKKVSVEDRNKAAAIRDYYSKKIMMGNLTDKMYKSNFRRDLSTFVIADGKRFKDTDIGMACYLPDFYDYDVEIDGVKAQVFTTINVPDDAPTVMKLDKVMLTPLKKVFKKTKRSKVLEYWFKDDTVNAAVVLSLEPKNQLIRVWDGIFNSSTEMPMTGYFHRTDLDGFEYFRVTNWDLVKA